MVFSRDRHVTVLDFSDSRIKALVVSYMKGEASVEKVETAPIKGDSEKEVAKQIRSLLARLKEIRSLQYVSFPRHLVTIRTVRLPTVNVNEIQDMAELQAIKYVPYAREEVVVSYRILERSKDGYSKLILVLAQRKSVERYMAILNAASVRPEKMALNAEGLFEWFASLKMADKRPVAVIEIDRRHTQILIIRNGMMLFSRAISFDAEKDPFDETSIIREIRLSIDSYNKEYEERISRIYLTGSRNYTAKLEPSIKSGFVAPCEVLEQLYTIKSGEETAKVLQSGRDSFSSLAGIALNAEKLSINLLPSDVLSKRKEQALKREFIKTGVLFLSVLVAVFGMAEKKMNDKRSYLRRLERQISEIEPEVKRLSKLRGNIELIRAQLTFRGSAIDILREVYTLLPEDISLTLLEFEDGSNLLIRGTTDDLGKVFKLLPALERSAYFESVKISYATKRIYRGQELADFEIICSLD